MVIEDKLEVKEKVEDYPATFAGERRAMRLSVHCINTDRLLQEFSDAGINIDQNLSYYIASDCDISFSAKLDLTRFTIEGYRLVAENSSRVSGHKEGLEIKVTSYRDKHKQINPKPSYEDALMGKKSYSTLGIEATFSYTGKDKENGTRIIETAKKVLQEHYDGTAA